jgi:hypothetical protein
MNNKKKITIRHPTNIKKHIAPTIYFYTIGAEVALPTLKYPMST